MNETNPFAPPKAPVRDAIEESGVDIDALDVSETWKTRFRLLERAGGPKMPHINDLRYGDRTRVMFNILAFLFGPLYYVSKGMWRKAITFFLIGVAAIVILTFVFEALGWSSVNRALSYGLAAFFSMRANIDYYKRVVLGDNGWL
jgi:hypothetical protein